MILHFSHIGFTEALTFIAPGLVSTTGLLRAPGVGRQARTFGPVGRRRKIAGEVLWGGVGLEGAGHPSQNARQEPRLSVLRGVPRTFSPHAPRYGEASNAECQFRPTLRPRARSWTRRVPEAGTIRPEAPRLRRLGRDRRLQKERRRPRPKHSSAAPPRVLGGAVGAPSHEPLPRQPLGQRDHLLERRSVLEWEGAQFDA
jgi:hypothetical protein